MDTISSTAFGVQVDSISDPNHPIMHYANRVIGNTKANLFGRIKAGLRVAVFGELPK